MCPADQGGAPGWGSGRGRPGWQGHSIPASPMICGKEPLSKSNSTVPVCRHVRSSKRLCRDSVDTWGLLQRSPPSSTFSSNFIHLQELRKELSMASTLGRSTCPGLLREAVLACKSCYTHCGGVGPRFTCRVVHRGTLHCVLNPLLLTLSCSGQSDIQRMTINGYEGSFQGGDDPNLSLVMVAQLCALTKNHLTALKMRELYGML